MKMDWSKYLNRDLNIILNENYGMVYDPGSNTPIYEIVFRTGKLIANFDDALLIENFQDGKKTHFYIPLSAVKCIEISV